MTLHGEPLSRQAFGKLNNRRVALILKKHDSGGLTLDEAKELVRLTEDVNEAMSVYTKERLAETQRWLDELEQRLANKP
jgi:hypothetical protein